MALVLSEKRGRVGLVALNRPEALNALNAALLKELVEAVAAHDADDSVGAIVVTGSERAFAAGADIKEMAEAAFPDAYARDRAATLSRFAARKPLIAAVAGHALGGGCELALACDIIIAADTAKFGQPEITLGIIPGMGGTQRLPRAVGKAQALDMILTARIIDAAEALRTGLVSRVVPASELSATAFAVAEKIAALSLPAVIAAKESIARAYELPLAEGVRRERELFHALFATEDQKEGMAAFIAKRPPDFRNR